MGRSSVETLRSHAAALAEASRTLVTALTDTEHLATEDDVVQVIENATNEVNHRLQRIQGQMRRRLIRESDGRSFRKSKLLLNEFKARWSALQVELGYMLAGVQPNETAGLRTAIPAAMRLRAKELLTSVSALQIAIEALQANTAPRSTPPARRRGGMNVEAVRVDIYLDADDEATVERVFAATSSLIECENPVY